MRRFRLIRRSIGAGVFLALLTCQIQATEPATIGFPRTMTVWIPGPQVYAIPRNDRRSPVLVRVDKATADKEGFRYELTYVGFEPGKFDLKDALQRADGTPPLAISVPVEVVAIRPAGEIQLSALADPPLPRIGGYRLVVWLAGTLWLLGLVGLIVTRRRSSETPPSLQESVETLESRLRSLLATAIAGTATEAQYAELERNLLVYWIRRLGLQSLTPAASMEAILKHPEAGPMLRNLEAMLHTPRSKEFTLNRELFESLVKPLEYPHERPTI